MITIIGRKLIIPDCDRVLGVAGDKNTPIKVKVSADTLNRYFDGKNYGDIAVILKLKHEKATVDLSPILCWHHTDGVYVGDVSLISTVEKGLVTCQALLIAPGSAAKDSDLNDAEALWQSDEDYFYISDDIELKNYSSGSDEYNAFETLLRTIADRLKEINDAKDAAIENQNAVLTARDNAGQAAKSSYIYSSNSEASARNAKKSAEDAEASARNAKKSAEDAEAAKELAANLLAPYNEHLENESNPHKVTASQVGAYTKEEVDKKFENIDVDVDLSDYVKNTDYAKPDVGGVVKIRNDTYGLQIGAENGIIFIKKATEKDIDGKVHEYKPIVPSNLEYAVKSVGDGYYATEDAVFEKGSFVWTDFHYDVEAVEWDDIYSLSDNQIMGGGAKFTIHCNGKTLGFDYTCDNNHASYIEINGVRYTSGSGSIPLTYMESDIVVYCSLATYEFTNMIQQSIKGVSELESQIGDIDTALDAILDIQANLTGMADVELPGGEDR